MDKIADAFGLLMVAAIAGVIVGSPYTRGQINALTGGMADMIRAATGSPAAVQRARK